MNRAAGDLRRFASSSAFRKWRWRYQARRAQ